MEVENHLNWTEGLINAIDYIETHLIDGEVLDQNTILHLNTDMTHPKASRRLSHAFMETLQLMFEITSPISIISPGLY